MAAKVTDLRSALKMLEDMPGQLIETDASDQRRTGNDI